jgi:hypothetical protein
MDDISFLMDGRKEGRKDEWMDGCMDDVSS